MQIVNIPGAEENNALSEGSNGLTKLRGIHMSKVRDKGGVFILINPVNTKQISRNFSIFMPATNESVESLISGMRRTLEERPKQVEVPIIPGKGVECWGKNKWNKLCGFAFERYKFEGQKYLLMQPVNTKGKATNFYVLLPPSSDVVDALEKGLNETLKGKTHKLTDHPLEWAV